MGDEPRSVLLCTPVFPPARGGIEAIGDRLAHALAAARIHVVTLDEPGAAELDAAAPFAVTRVRNEPRGGRGAILRLNAAVARAGLRGRPDVVLSLHVALAPACGALRRARGIPFVQYVHAKEVRQLPYLAAAAVRGASGVVAVSRYARDLADEAGADDDAIRVIHPGVALPGAVAEPRAAQPTLLSVSRLADRNKGHDVVLAALPQIARHVPDVRWVVVGDGPLRAELEAQAERAGVAGRVTFTGGLSDAERDAWLDRATLFVLPTRRPADGRGGEGFGMVYVEAAAHGLPSVASRVPGVVDAVRDGETGTLVAPEDPAALAAAVVALLADRDRLERYRAGARAWAAELAWERIVPQVDAVLHAAVAPGRGRSRGRAGHRGRARLWPLDLALPLPARRPFTGLDTGRPDAVESNSGN